MDAPDQNSRLLQFYEPAAACTQSQDLLRLFLGWAREQTPVFGGVFYKMDSSFDFTAVLAAPGDAAGFFAKTFEAIVETGLFAKALSGAGPVSFPCAGGKDRETTVVEGLLVPIKNLEYVYGVLCLYSRDPLEKWPPLQLREFHQVLTMTGRLYGSLESQAEIMRQGAEAGRNNRLRQQLLQQLSEGVLILDSDWVIQAANPAALRLLGRQETEVAGKPLETFLSPSSPALLERIRILLDTEGVVRNVEIPLKRLTGDVVPVNFSITITRTEDGLPDACIVTIEDLTAIRGLMHGLEKARSLMELEKSSLEDTILHRTGDLQDRIRSIEYLAELHESVLHHMSSGVIVLSSDLGITLYNRAASVITGIDASDVHGKNLADFPNLLRLTGYCRSLFVSRRNEQGVEACIMDSGGRPVTLSLSSALLFTPLKELRGAVIVFADVTQIREMHRKLLTNERMAALGKMAAAVAHEIRNPLNVMRGLAEIITRKELDLEKIRQYMATIIAQIDRLEILLREIVDFIRQREPCFQKQDLVRMIQDIAAIYREGFLSESRKAVTLRVETTPRGLPAIFFDRDQIQQIMFNLIRNAVDAISDAGTIVISISEHKEFLEVIVEDDGCGIESSLLDQIFEPFFTTKRTEGTGLGLSIVKSIMDLHRGTIQVESRLNRGTTFRLRFPKEDQTHG